MPSCRAVLTGPSIPDTSKGESTGKRKGKNKGDGGSKVCLASIMVKTTCKKGWKDVEGRNKRGGKKITGVVNSRARRWAERTGGTALKSKWKGGPRGGGWGTVRDGEVLTGTEHRALSGVEGLILLVQGRN